MAYCHTKIGMRTNMWKSSLWKWWCLNDSMNRTGVLFHWNRTVWFFQHPWKEGREGFLPLEELSPGLSPHKSQSCGTAAPAQGPGLPSLPSLPTPHSALCFITPKLSLFQTRKQNHSCLKPTNKQTKKQPPKSMCGRKGIVVLKGTCFPSAFVLVVIIQIESSASKWQACPWNNMQDRTIFINKTFQWYLWQDWSSRVLEPGKTNGNLLSISFWHLWNLVYVAFSGENRWS